MQQFLVHESIDLDTSMGHYQWCLSDALNNQTLDFSLLSISSRLRRLRRR